MTEHPLVTELRTFSYPAWDSLADSEVDMVMKGGITSGVVYPLAVCELAKTRRFRALGGTSAGGIAAGLAAAAELGRDVGGFQRYAELPNALGANLQQLFQPSKETKPLHRIMLASMDKEHGKVVSKLLLGWSIIVAGMGWFLVAVAAVLGLALLIGTLAGGEAVPLVLGALIPALVVGFVAAAIGVALGSRKRLAANGYGVCIGSRGPAWSAEGVEPFTDWLHAKFNEIAGRPRSDVATFKDLWGGMGDKGKAPTDPRIRLEMMTTNVTFCRPVRLPFDANLYFFCPQELARWFPPPVMKHLLENQRPASTTPARVWACPEHPGEELCRMPLAADLPLLVAIRMTLSFPFLISAVPLYAIDYGPAQPEPVKCWFSDGGISSNFPIHFFDSLWPRRPTFGISLGPYPKGREQQDVYFRGETVQAVPRVRDSSSFTKFLAAIADTLQNWSDEGQSMLPGYRDRIVEVHHTEEEGGMNLNMKPETIMAMCLRGHAAAVALNENFNFGRHRDIRYRSAMASLDRAARDMLRKYDKDLAKAQSGYRSFIDKLEFKGVSAAWRTQARERTDALLSFAGRPSGDAPDPFPDDWPTASAPDFTKQDVEPRPVPELRMTARF
jgi:predicted acylesterase/phospholipase RssA